jgi:hypothetical protein
MRTPKVHPVSVPLPNALASSAGSSGYASNQSSPPVRIVLLRSSGGGDGSFRCDTARKAGDRESVGVSVRLTCTLSAAARFVMLSVFAADPFSEVSWPDRETEARAYCGSTIAK